MFPLNLQNTCQMKHRIVLVSKQSDTFKDLKDQKDSNGYKEHKCRTILKTTKRVCGKTAYYIEGTEQVCGRHAPNKIKNPYHTKTDNTDNISAHKLTIEKSIVIGKVGNIICCKMRMMSSVPLIPGYLNIFPNAKHANRKDGVGMPSLSPKVIGPIDHGQVDAKGNKLPPSLTLEGFHQFNKVFSFEIDSKGNLTPEFFERQLFGYNCQAGQAPRHKYGQTKDEHLKYLKNKGVDVKDSNINIPLFSVIWSSLSNVKGVKGELYKYTYFESRWFYCTYLEQSVLKNPDYQWLVKELKRGVSLQICGYDGYPITKSYLEHYKDTSVPFGHELVIMAMLNRELTGQEVPWLTLGKPKGTKF